MLVIAGVTFLFLGVYFLIDYIITRHRLKINQNAWDEYSANMDFNRKVYAYLPWCIEQKKQKTGGAIIIFQNFKEQSHENNRNE